ncbi:MAG: hypothetical protein MHM6MM_006476 [Cercozoa sp. M6MM]
MGQQQSSLSDQIFEIKFASKRLAKESTKCLKKSRAERSKVAAALKDGDQERAQIYAQNVIRHKNESVNFLRISSRLDAVAQRMQSMQSQRMMSKSIGNVVQTMNVAMKQMDVEKMTRVMDQFERQFEDLDVQSAVMDQTVQRSTGMVTETDQVHGLMAEIADENGLEIDTALEEAPTTVRQTQAQTETATEDDLEARLNKLMQGS